MITTASPRKCALIGFVDLHLAIVAAVVGLQVVDTKLIAPIRKTVSMGSVKGETTTMRCMATPGTFRDLGRAVYLSIVSLKNNVFAMFAPSVVGLSAAHHDIVRETKPA